MKKILSLLLSLSMLLTLGACGGGDDPDAGLYICTGAKMLGLSLDAGELFESGSSLELKAGGKGRATTDGASSSLKWTLEGKTITLTIEGEVFTGTLEGGVIEVEMLGMLLTFVKEGIEPPPAEVSAGDAGYYVLDSVIEDGVTVSGDELKAMGLGWYIVLGEDGSAGIMLDSYGAGTWEDGTMSFTQDGATEEINYVIEGDKLTIDIDGLAIIFTRSDETPPAIMAQSSGGEAPPKDLPEYLQWWDGDWYGRWYMYGGSPSWEHLNDIYWDCCATIDVRPDGTAQLKFYDLDGYMYQMALVELTITESGGSGPMGAAMSESGSFSVSDVGHADWIIDPSLYEYDDYLVIDGYYEDPDDGSYYYYSAYMRPWGMLWDDIPAEERPPFYRDWYLDCYDLPMPGIEDTETPEDGAPAGSDTAAENPGEYVWNDEIYISWPVESFYLNDWGLTDIVASDGSVTLTVFPYSNKDSYISAMELMSQYEGEDGYTIDFLAIAGYEAVKITFEGYDDYTSMVYINFNNEGQDGVRYYGAMVDCVSEIDMASTWTPEIMSILESIRVTTGNPY